MVSAKEEEERISSPIDTVSCTGVLAGYVEVESAVKKGMGRRTSFSILTLALMPSNSLSFWFSSSERTASLYWPL